MSAFSRKLSGLPGMFVLLFMFAVYSSAVRAEMPDAQSRIGTQATITFSDDKGEHTKKSDPVYTVVAQVHQVDVRVMNEKTSVVPGENVDIAFALTNTGNGVDDMIITANELPQNVDSVTVFEADEGGRATSEIGQEISAGGKGEFKLAMMKRRELRNFVVRMRAPATLGAGQELRINLVATPSGVTDAAKPFSGSAVTIGSTPFVVTPGKSVTLDSERRAAVAFIVTPGADAVNGYFELFLTKRNDSKPLKFKVVDDEVHFDGEIVKKNDTKANNGHLFFKMIHQVPGNKNSEKVNFNMRIEVPDAVQGDEMLLFVDYSKGKDSTVQPEEGVAVARSNGLLVSWPHAAADFSLDVIGNSIDTTSNDFSIVANATAGSVVDYEISVENNGSRDDTYAFERLKSEGTLILDVTAIDQNGQDNIRVGTGGLPEIGPLAPHGTAIFKVRVRLLEARVATTPQVVKFSIKSLTAKILPPKEQKLTINTVSVGAPATVIFLAEATDTQKIDGYNLPPGQDEARIYAKITNSDLAVHQYRIVSNDEITLFPFVDGVCSTVATSVTGMVDKNGKLFCVNVDMVEQSQLAGEVRFTDIVTNAEKVATILIVKPGAVRFASDSYSAGGAAGLTSDVTVAMINRGGDTNADKYEVWFDTADSESKTKNWELKFSLDKKDWFKTLSLPAMDAGVTVPLFIKIEVPPGVNEDEKWPLRVGIREQNAESNISLTIISLSLNVIDLKVVKQVSIQKNAICVAALIPEDFAAASAHKIAAGDCVWYRVTVTNVSTMPANQMVIRDPLPKHATYNNSMATVVADDKVGVELQGNNIVTGPTTLAINKKLVLTYPVQVDFNK